MDTYQFRVLGKVCVTEGAGFASYVWKHFFQGFGTDLHSVSCKVFIRLVGNFLCMRPANERQDYNVKSSHIAWAHTQNDPGSCEDHWGGWGCEVSCGGHHRLRGKTTTGSALDGAVFDIAQILAYLVHNMSRSQLYLGFGHFGWLPSFFQSIAFWRACG